MRGSQLSFGYRPAHLGHEAWTQRLEAIRAATSHLGLKEVAFELDVAPSTLCDAIAERERKRFAGEWIDIVLAQLTSRQDPACDRLAMAIIEPTADILPITIGPRKRMTPEERAAAYERELMAMGAPGAEALARVESGRSR